MLDNSQLFVNDIENNHKQDQTLVKLNLPFEFYFDNDAVVILNTIFELDKEEFGGLNLQVNLPF